MAEGRFVNLLKIIGLVAFGLFAVTAIFVELTTDDPAGGESKFLRVSVRVGLAALGSLLTILFAEGIARLRGRRPD